MVTSRDVAKEAGVSQATVSRVISGQPAVRDSTRARVLTAMQNVGYVPNLAAQSMKTGRANAVGVVVADLENPFYPELLSALSKEFDAADMRISVWVSDREKNHAAVQAIRQGTVDGVVFTTVTEESLELRDALRHGSPVVLVNRSLPSAQCDQVSSDNEEGSRQVANYFLGHGRVRPAFIGGTESATTTRHRLHGFASALERAGIALPRESIVTGEYTRASGYRSMQRLLETGSPPDAVFCSNDMLAFGALDAARAFGLRAPEHVWVVGYDDVDMASWEAFDLTTVRQDTSRLAATAARLLMARIDAPGRPAQHEVLPASLVVRGSTGHSPVLARGG